MENAADALQMAAFVLIFVLALSISINAFGEARQTSQILLDYRDREYDYTYIQYESDQTERIVSGETIIPCIYKAYKENYKIVFKKQDGNPMPLYEKSVASNSSERKNIYAIDLEKDVIGDDAQKEKFIKYLLYGGNLKNFSDIEQFEKSGIFIDKTNFYDIVKGHTYKEKLGIYYQEELQEGEDESKASNANKTKKRVITYTQI